jgi:hypothetical protein
MTFTMMKATAGKGLLSQTIQSMLHIVNSKGNLLEISSRAYKIYKKQSDSQSGVASTMTNWMFEDRIGPAVPLYVPKVYPTETIESTGI